MLERISEKSGRAMYYAMQEATVDGKDSPEMKHVVMGLARENEALFQALGMSMERLFPDLPSSRDLTKVELKPGMNPFSKDITQVIQHSVKEADVLGHRIAGTGHLLLAVFLEDAEMRSLMENLGVTADRIRKQIAEEPAEKVFSSEMMKSSRGYMGRSGIGYDLHRLEPGRKLRIGGVEIPFDKGSVGHSDGDVLLHAICDALLGAAGLGDIGTHFPDTDPKWKGADSLGFLKHVHELFEKYGLHIFHIDAVVILERPKLGPHFPAMREAIAKALGMDADCINLKAKTNEGVDAVGRGEAIAAHAVATIAG
jgi:2-C-methyl-D-erythritol 2,4-cyclodiphosphate synthase